VTLRAHLPLRVTARAPTCPRPAEHVSRESADQLAQDAADHVLAARRWSQRQPAPQTKEARSMSGSKVEEPAPYGVGTMVDNTPVISGQVRRVRPHHLREMKQRGREVHDAHLPRHVHRAGLRWDRHRGRGPGVRNRRALPQGPASPRSSSRRCRHGAPDRAGSSVAHPRVRPHRVRPAVRARSGRLPRSGTAPSPAPSTPSEPSPNPPEEHL
jgi:hypothetical protein